MKTLAELEEIRKKSLAEIGLRTNRDATRIVVGMATCGIAAGAREVLKAMTDELAKRDIHNVVITQTGCIGVCRLEPIVEVIEKDGKRVTYVNMTPEKGIQVVSEHIVYGKVCSDFILKENT